MITVEVTKNWQDYELIDSGSGYRLERFGKYTLARPDPQVIWPKRGEASLWNKADAVFTKKSLDAGSWMKHSTIPDSWTQTWNDLTFSARLTPFKHTGIFPEQAGQWDWMNKRVRDANRQVRVLNLFGYTGIASLAAASAGAHITHVDASKPAVSWAKENQVLSKCNDKPIRWIVDDARDFVAREFRRNSFYDAILMDPPAYGHGPKSEPWDFQKDFFPLFQACGKILTKNPIFFLINTYAVSCSSLMLKNVLDELSGSFGGTTTVGELALEESVGKRLLSTGIFGKWEE